MNIKHLEPGPKDAGFTVLARVEGNGGANITIASLDEIRRYVTYRDGTPDTTGTEITISDVVSDTPDTSDDRWNYDPEEGGDAEGPNFVDPIPASEFDSVGPAQITYKFTPATGYGEPWFDVYQRTIEDPLAFN